MNEGHKKLSLEAASIQVSRRAVGGGYEGEAAVPEATKEARENHRVGDVGDKKLVKREQARLGSDAVSDAYERVLHAPSCLSHTVSEPKCHSVVGATSVHT